MTDLSRQVQRAAFRLADDDATRSGQQYSPLTLATVAAVSPGAAADGQAIVAVTWHGSDHQAAGYAASYTPQVGDRVRCSVIDDQLFVDFAIVGYSPVPEQEE